MSCILVLAEEKALAETALDYATALAEVEGADVLTINVANIRTSVEHEIAMHQPHLVVLATRHRPSVSGLLVHDLADRILGSRLAPVLLVDSANHSRGLHRSQVLVPLDGSEIAEAALPTALELARVLQGGIVLLQAVPPVVLPYAVPPELERNLQLDLALAWDPRPELKAAQAYLDLVVKRLAQAADGTAISTEVRLGGLADQLAQLLHSAPAVRLIVMTSQARSGLTRWLLGSSLAEVVHAVNIPVLAVPPLRHTRSHPSKEAA